MSIDQTTQVPTEVNITHDKVLDLKRIIGSDFERTEGLVMLHLRSRFPKRQAWASRTLQSFLAYTGAQVDVHTLTDSGITYVYIQLLGIDKYLFVAQYRESDPILEELPSPEDQAKW